MNNRYICKAKRKDNNEWVEGYYVCLNGDRHFIYTGYAETDCGEYYPDCHEVIPETVVRCTGLKDKNGKLIFEGNIVKLTDINNGVEWRAYVVFGNPYGAYDWGWNLMYIGEEPNINTDILLWIEMEEAGAYCEVIGNIHDDNLELLEV